MTKSEKTRQMIIERSAVLFNERGFAGTSMSDIMDETGLTKGGLYGNFKSKEEIAVAAFLHSVKYVSKVIRKRTRFIDNSLDKLKTVVYFYKERVLDPPVKGGCPILNTSIEADDNNPVLKEEVVKAMQFWHKRIVTTIEEGIQNEEIIPEAKPVELATFFIGCIEGGIMMARINNDPEMFNVMANHLLIKIDTIRMINSLK